jgi:flagellar hook-associated protein 2
LRDAINAAEAGVNASVIFDGSNYRLALSSEKTGASNSMEITVSDPSLSQFEFNASATNLTQTQNAQDAILSVNGLDVTNASNSFTETLKGVTFDLKKVELGKTVSVEVSRSSSDIVGSLQGFVDTYNELISSVNELTRFDPTTQQASVLLGDATLRSGMSQIRSVLSRMVSGLENTSIRTLSDLGVTTEIDGSLAFDSSKLTAALESDPDGVEAVFTVLGRPDNAGVSYFDSTSNTVSGKYAVNITQAASNGVLNSGPIGSFTVATGSNDTFKLSLDGTTSGQITLTAGTYTGATLATEMQSRINGDAAIKGQTARVQVDFDSANNRFVFTSDTFGVESKVAITETTAGTLGLNVATGTDGTDVAGTIGGTLAEGKGQFLTGANGLKLLIDGDLTGSLGTVAFSRGLMEELDLVLGGLLDGDGTLKAKTEGLQKSLEQIGDERLDLNERMFKYEERLLSRFNAMDAMLANLQGTSSFLTQQLASLPYNNLPDR